MQIWRGGATRDMTVTVGEMLDEPVGRAVRRSKPAEPALANRLGLVLSEPNTEQKRRLGIRNGLIVEEVREGGRGELRQGDIILALIQRGVQTEIRSIDQFNSLLGKNGRGGAMTLLVRRGESQTFVTIRGAQDK